MKKNRLFILAALVLTSVLLLNGCTEFFDMFGSPNTEETSGDTSFTAYTDDDVLTNGDFPNNVFYAAP